MARLVAAFGSSHSTMLLSSVEHWIELFDQVDRKAPVYDFSGTPRSFDALLRELPANAAELVSPEAVAGRFQATAEAMQRLDDDIRSAPLDALIVIGDDQREIFQDACRPAIGIYYGDTIRNAAAPKPAPAHWYYRDQHKRLEDEHDVHYACHAGLARHLIEGLTDTGFDITAVQALAGHQFEGHAFSFIHRRYLRGRPLPIVPVFLNTYYPPNQPTPARCFEFGLAIARLVASFADDLRVGIMASGGLSHFLVNEELDRQVIDALKRSEDGAALKELPLNSLRSGSSEIRNWICLAAAVTGVLGLDWISYVPAYRSRALTGVGLCFAAWR